MDNYQKILLKTYLDEIGVVFNSEGESISYLIESHRHLKNYKSMVWETCRNMPRWKQRIARLLGFFPFD